MSAGGCCPALIRHRLEEVQLKLWGEMCAMVKVLKFYQIIVEICSRVVFETYTHEESFVRGNMGINFQVRNGVAKHLRRDGLFVKKSWKACNFSGCR